IVDFGTWLGVLSSGITRVSTLCCSGNGLDPFWASYFGVLGKAFRLH
ncbi:unnamed protein product, partial [Musa acuminata subsp. burmannicoides]